MDETVLMESSGPTGTGSLSAIVSGPLPDDHLDRFQIAKTRGLEECVFWLMGLSMHGKMRMNGVHVRETPMPRCLQTTPLTEVLGAEVVGARADLAYDGEEIAALKTALAEHHVLLLRNTAPTDEQYFGFADQFGTVSGTPGLDKSLIGSRPVVRPVGVDDPDRPSVTMKNNDFEWHTDGQAYEGVLGKESFLQAFVIPSHGGATSFVSTYGVYDALPNAMKTRLDGVRTRAITGLIACRW
jgi:hypothetical protein